MHIRELACRLAAIYGSVEPELPARAVVVMAADHGVAEEGVSAYPQEVTAQMGKSFAAPRVARGAAYADIDNDGFLDVLVTTNAGPAYLFHNEGGANHSLRLRLVGTRSNRDGIGAVVHVTSGNNQDKQWKMLRSGSSYLSQSELVLTFGLGAQTKADSVEIQWPSGQVDKLSNVNAGQTVTIEEGKGIVGARSYAPPSKSYKQ